MIHVSWIIMNYQNRGDQIIHDIMQKPNSIIVVLYIFHIIHPQKQKQSVQPFCFWGEHSKGLSYQADVELDMINAISAADIAFIMSSSQAIVYWLNALDQYFIVSHIKRSLTLKHRSDFDRHLPALWDVFWYGHLGFLLEYP